MADLPVGPGRRWAPRCTRPTGPAYAYFYWDEVDATGHQHGPSSPQFAAAAERCLDALDAGLRALPEGTLVLLAADHGQVDVDPATTVYVNEAWPEIVDLLARDGRGRPLAPAGSARDLFLHCRPEAIDELVDGLARLLGERATVHRVADVVAAGWLGTVGERLRARLADVCVLPAPGRDGLVARAPSLRHALPRPPRRAVGGRGAHAGRRAGRLSRGAPAPLGASA